MSASVSRETSPSVPEEAAVLFGERLPLAKRYAELLAGAGVVRGLLGPREVPRLWDRHLSNCALIAGAFARGETVCDVGAGAGLPGIVLAIVRPDLQITLLEPLLRRVTFLHEAVETLGLEQVRVVRGRAEDQRDLRVDAVTARAVAPLDRLAGWCLPLCRPGGRMVAMKGVSAADELHAHSETLRRLGARSWQVREFSSSVAASTVVIEVVAGGRRPDPTTGRPGAGRVSGRQRSRSAGPRPGGRPR